MVFVRPGLGGPRRTVDRWTLDRCTYKRQSRYSTERRQRVVQQQFENFEFNPWETPGIELCSILTELCLEGVAAADFASCFSFTRRAIRRNASRTFSPDRAEASMKSIEC